MTSLSLIVLNVAIVAAMVAIVAYMWYHRGPAPEPPGPLYPIAGRMMNFDGSGPYAVVAAADAFAIASQTPTRLHFGVATIKPAGGFVMSMGDAATELFVVWMDAGGINLRVASAGSVTPTVTVSSGVTPINVLDGGWHTIDYTITYSTTSQAFSLSIDGTLISAAVASGMHVRATDVHVGNRPAGVLADYGAPLFGCVRDLTFNDKRVNAVAHGKVGSSCKVA
jgi:Laminin G domain